MSTLLNLKDARRLFFGGNEIDRVYRGADLLWDRPSASMWRIWNETQGLSIDFTDSFYSSTGFFGSASVKDTTTPANNYDAAPTTATSSLLTYSSPTAKLTRGSSGLFRYQAHNLYLNSAAPANQSITVVPGATYSITITGSVSMVASGAATGTWTAGAVNFTAATGTLTLASTTGAGTVHLRRTPSESTYLATAGTARFALPMEWNTSGTPLGIRVESAATNLCLWSNDLTNAAWTKSNMTTSRTATGPDGVANAATICTATAGNATALQAITSTSQARITGVGLRRRTGTGNVDLTQDNGTTWTTQALTSSWQIFPLPSVTSANPTVGIRIVTSGDAVDVAYFKHETGAVLTSPIETFGATVTRAADNISLATSAFPWSNTEVTIVAQVSSFATTAVAIVEAAATARADARAALEYSAPSIRAVATAAAFSSQYTQSFTVTLANQNKIAARFRTNDFHSAANGILGTPDTSGTFAASPLVNVTFGSQGAAGHLNGHLQTILILPRAASNTELQTLST